ncbi:thrombopoietin receptor [Spea bombifrons]|uniref:thrombopoietin receptor n=1 Tax=Spea bombifrons TaxID=233779 RepID=UPI00234ABFB3|nr:thrombopoietin receptor [Spea bombifrons]
MSITDQDIKLVSADGKNPHCFSRYFEDLACFWKEEKVDNEEADAEDGLRYAFFYRYADSPENECNLTVQHGGQTLYVCYFPEDDVRLFSDLTVSVKDRGTNQTLYHRTLEVESVGLIEHPTNITVSWSGNGRSFHLNWNPPKHDFSLFFVYDIQYWAENSPDKYHQIIRADELPCNLNDLKTDVLYNLRVRTKINNGNETFWGPWSEAITFFSPASTDNIGLHCFTPDLVWVCCNWNQMEEDIAGLQQLFYQYGGRGWQPCTEDMRRTDCDCVFKGENETPVSIAVNVSSIANAPRVYYKEPFWINHVVFPPSPELHLKQLLGGKVAVNWTVPMAEFEEDMSYEIRFSKDEGKTWKTLQVPRGVSHEVLDLISGSHYSLQIRARPSGERIQGFWSLWSPEMNITLPSSNGWMVSIIAAVLLLVPGSAVCIYCIFRSACGKLKDKLWPPLPNLHRVLDTFLMEIQKQYQPNSTLYEKPMEEALQPSCLEILGEEALSTEMLQISRDYVQLSPPLYQNEDFWPHLNLTLSLTGVNQTTNGISNQTYLTTTWNL